MGKASRQRRQKKEQERQKQRAARGQSSQSSHGGQGTRGQGGGSQGHRNQEYGGQGQGGQGPANQGHGSQGANGRQSGAFRPRAGHHAGYEEPPHAPSQEEQVALLISRALRAYVEGNDDRYTRYVDQLSSGLGPGWSRHVSRLLVDFLRNRVTAAWQAGWQPAELVRHVGRERSAAHASMVADVIVAEMRTYAAATVDPRWAAQVAALSTAAPTANDAEYLRAWRAAVGEADPTAAVDTAMQTLDVLLNLRILEKLLPLPGATTTARTAHSTSATPADDRMLARIRALLAKAESTEFAEEAEALSARAQELMAKYSIDHALLAAEAGEQEEPIGRRIPVDNPYDKAKTSLLNTVAEANRCRAIWSQDVGLVTVIGFPADLDVVELLFTSLLVQANTAMMRAGGRKDEFGRSRTRAFRQSFLVSYAIRIGERLAEAATHAEKEAVAEQEAKAAAHAENGEHPEVHGRTGMDLVPFLAARREAVDDAVDELFGDRLTRGRASRVTDAEGWVAGRAAADMATLHNRDAVAG